MTPTPLQSIEVGSGLLYPALRKAGVTLAPGRGPSPAQFKDALEEVNRLMGSLNCDPYFVYSQDVVPVPLTAGKLGYTIGIDPSSPAADIPVEAPVQMTFANHMSNGMKRELSVLTTQQWVTGSQGANLQGIFYDRGYPIGRIYLDGPAEGGSLELYVWHSIPKIANPTDTVSLRSGYEDAIVLNLACRLAPQFQRPVDPDLRQQARESLMRIESLNAPRPIAETGALGCCGGGYNVYTDES